MSEERPLLRFRSVRSKPTSFSGWRESVKEAATSNCDASDIEDLIKGTKLWKIRKKMFKGLVCYQRVFRLDMESLCVLYGSTKTREKSTIDIADIVEVRRGFSTDTFNEVEKRPARFKIADFLRADNCFSIIFAPRLNRPSLDLVARDRRISNAWVSTLTRLINAAKSIEIQKEYELYLRNQFHAADENRSGNLTINEFSILLRQLNINLNEEQITQIFDEVNTDRTPEVNGGEKGEQVIDEHEFLEFYHNFLGRDDLNDLFTKYAKKYDGLAMTVGELRKFLCVEQKTNVTDAEGELIVAEFEPSAGRRKQKLLSEEGFSRFFLFSDLHDIIDQPKTEAVYQVIFEKKSNYLLTLVSRIKINQSEQKRHQAFPDKK